MTRNPRFGSPPGRSITKSGGSSAGGGIGGKCKSPPMFLRAITFALCAVGGASALATVGSPLSTGRGGFAPCPSASLLPVPVPRSRCVATGRRLMSRDSYKLFAGMGDAGDRWQESAGGEAAIPWYALDENEVYLFRCPGHDLDGEVVALRPRSRSDHDKTIYVRPVGKGGPWRPARAMSRFYPTPAGFARGGLYGDDSFPQSGPNLAPRAPGSGSDDDFRDELSSLEEKIRMLANEWQSTKQIGPAGPAESSSNSRLARLEEERAAVAFAAAEELRRIEDEKRRIAGGSRFSDEYAQRGAGAAYTDRRRNQSFDQGAAYGSNVSRRPGTSAYETDRRSNQMFEDRSFRPDYPASSYQDEYRNAPSNYGTGRSSSNYGRGDQPSFYEDDRRSGQGLGDGPIPLSALSPTESYLYRSPDDDLDGEIVRFRRGNGGSYVRPARAGENAQWMRASPMAKFYPERVGFRPDYDSDRREPSSYQDIGRNAPSYYGSERSSSNYGNGDRTSPYMYEGGRRSNQGFDDGSIPLSALVEGERYMFRSPRHELDGSIVFYRRGSDGYHYVRERVTGQWVRAATKSKFYPVQEGFGDEYTTRSTYGNNSRRPGTSSPYRAAKESVTTGEELARIRWEEEARAKEEERIRKENEARVAQQALKTREEEARIRWEEEEKERIRQENAARVAEEAAKTKEELARTRWAQESREEKEERIRRENEARAAEKATKAREELARIRWEEERRLNRDDRY